MFLLPFSTWPRFIACDRQQNIYLVRADQQDVKVHMIGTTDNATAGALLADDESFIIITASHASRSSKVEKCSLAFVGEPSFHSQKSGRLHEFVDPKGKAIATTNYGWAAGSPCLLTLKPSGTLVCKIL